MIETDLQAAQIIEKQRKKTKDEIEMELLNIVLLLMKDYSFVENQTYPRPSHPK